MRTHYERYTTGLTLYVKERPLDTGTWANGIVVGTENGTTGEYAFVLGNGPYELFLQLGGSPADTDTPIGYVPASDAEADGEVTRSTEDTKPIYFGMDAASPLPTGTVSIDGGSFVAVAGAITRAAVYDLAGVYYFQLAHNAADRPTEEGIAVYRIDDGSQVFEFVLIVSGISASEVRDAIGMAAPDLDTQLDAITGGMGGDPAAIADAVWDELVADHQVGGSFGGIFQQRQYYAPSGSTIRYVTRGDSYDGTANDKLSWPVTVDYTTGWTGTLTVRHRTTNAVLLTKAVVVASAVLLECTLTVTDSAFALLTDDDEFGSHPYDVQLDDGTSQITVVTNGVMVIRRDSTTV